MPFVAWEADGNSSDGVAVLVTIRHTSRFSVLSESGSLPKECSDMADRIGPTGQWRTSRRGRRDGALLKLFIPVVLSLCLVACAPGVANPARQPGPTPTSSGGALARIHNVAPGEFILFARITFTADTNYDQAAAILKGHIYPWTCDDPRSPTPPAVADERASFASSHTLLMSYPSWDELTRIAASPQVVSVERIALYQCT